LCALLDSHPDLLVFPEETKYLSTYSIRKGDNSTWKIDRDEVSRCINMYQIFGEESLHSSGYRDYRHVTFSVFRDSVLKYFDASDKAVYRGLEAIMLGYHEASGRGALSVDKWVEKSPRNEKYFETAKLWWPEAKLIVMVRDPRKALLSHRRYQVKKKAKKRIALGDFVRAWLDTYIFASDEIEKKSKDLGPLIVKFEDLTTDREKTMREVASFINVQPDPVLYVPTKAGKSWEGNSSLGDSKVTHISADFLAKVRLGRVEKLYINIVLGFAIRELGYDYRRWLPWLPKRLSKAHGKLGYGIQLIGNLLSKE
jgi:hypothetical protein